MPDDSSSRFISPRDLLLLSRSLSRRTSSVLRESERVSVAVRRDIARCRHTAQALAHGDFLPALFDEIGFRYSLPGRELMLRAARVYVRLSADELCPFTYRLVLTALSDGAGRWADGQLSYLLDTVRGGGLDALCRHDGCTLSPERIASARPADVLTALRSVVYTEAYRRLFDAHDGSKE